MSAACAASGASAHVDDEQLVREALGVVEAQDVAVALGRDAARPQPALPEVERRVGRDAPLDRVDHAVARAAAAPRRGTRRT